MNLVRPKQLIAFFVLRLSPFSILGTICEISIDCHRGSKQKNTCRFEILSLRRRRGLMFVERPKTSNRSHQTFESFWNISDGRARTHTTHFSIETIFVWHRFYEQRFDGRAHATYSPSSTTFHRIMGAVMQIKCQHLSIVSWMYFDDAAPHFIECDTIWCVCICDKWL